MLAILGALPRSSWSRAMFARARLFALPVLLAACAPTYDVVIRHGTVYDGTGGVPARADVAIQGDIRQGVTLEVMGEGESMGPLTDSMKAEAARQQGDITYPITWTTLGEYLDTLVGRGISTNVASFVGATTVRIHEIGYADRPPTPEELQRMRAFVRP